VHIAKIGHEFWKGGNTRCTEESMSIKQSTRIVQEYAKAKLARYNGS